MAPKYTAFLAASQVHGRVWVCNCVCSSSSPIHLLFLTFPCALVLCQLNVLIKEDGPHLHVPQAHISVFSFPFPAATNQTHKIPDITEASHVAPHDILARVPGHAYPFLTTPLSNSLGDACISENLGRGLFSRRTKQSSSSVEWGKAQRR